MANIRFRPASELPKNPPDGTEIVIYCEGAYTEFKVLYFRDGQWMFSCWFFPTEDIESWVFKSELVGSGEGD